MANGQSARTQDKQVHFMLRLPTIIYPLLVVLALLFLAAAVEAQDCSSAQWRSMCNQDVQRCQFINSQAAGCIACTTRQSCCFDCSRGFSSPLEETVQAENLERFDESSQFAGIFTRERNSRFRITNPGYLTRYGVQKGDIVKRINGWKVNRSRLHRLAMRRHPAMRLVVYTPRARQLRTFTALP